jgi:hypothetical protein
MQVVGCLAWFLLDVVFLYVAITYACAPERQRKVAICSILGTIVGAGFFYALGQAFPDDGEQCTAYWAGWCLEMPVGWVSIYYLFAYGHKEGQSLEPWYVGSLNAA